MTTVGSLCSGYGGVEMGLALAGLNVDLRWLAEVDPALDPVHPAGVPNLGDISRVDWSEVERVDLITAGFPCQPVSAAGRQRGTADDRWLWPHVRDALATLQPNGFLLENVRNLVSISKGEVWAGILADLGALGYSVRWLTIGACHVGAAQHRHRVFAVASLGDEPTDRVERVATSSCGAKLAPILPTPRHRDWKGAETAAARAGRVERGTAHEGYDLPTAVTLLPTPGHADGRRGVEPAESGRIARPTGHSYGASLPTAVTLLPTPMARDGNARGEGTAEYWATRPKAKPLGAEVALLPTPTAGDSRGSRNATAARSEGQEHHHSGWTLSDVAHASGQLLPTPTSSEHYGPGHAGDGGQNLRTAATALEVSGELLPTPRASDGPNGGPGQRGRRGDLAMPSAVQPQNWGRFTDAVARHAAIYGEPPAPTEPNRNGLPRLAPAFAEWLMCLPPGHVTDKLARVPALRAIGNGVCPPQLAAAWGLLTSASALAKVSS